MRLIMFLVENDLLLPTLWEEVCDLHNVNKKNPTKQIIDQGLVVYN